jgi:hypothetical protein
MNGDTNQKVSLAQPPIHLHHPPYPHIKGIESDQAFLSKGYSSDPLVHIPIPRKILHIRPQQSKTSYQRLPDVEVESLTSKSKVPHPRAADLRPKDLT